jgi:hypothetical protein
MADVQYASALFGTTPSPPTYITLPYLGYEPVIQVPKGSHLKEIFLGFAI